LIPKREQVLAHARELFFQEAYRGGIQNVNTPEDSELVEGGFYSQSLSELMRDKSKAQNTEWKNYNENLETFSVNLEELFEGNALILGSRHTGKSDLSMMICDKAMLEKAIVVVFDPSQDWSVRSSISRVMKVEPYTVLDVPNESVIYDVSLCSPQDQQRIVENFAKNLFEYQASNPERKRYLIIFEEAHTYFFQNAMRSKNAVNSVRMLSVGRNVGIACLLISQFACTIDKFCVRHTLSQAWFGFTREPNDIKYLKQILGSDVKELPKLKDGEFLYLTRNGLSKIAIEPFENTTPKITTAILKPDAELTRPRSDATLAIARLILMIVFCAIIAGSLRF
jgi:hypothetical protein